MNSDDEPKWWFPRKTFGWGWGLPSTWQGWTALLVFLFLLCVGGPLTSSVLGNSAALVAVIALTVSFLVIVVVKGEPLRGAADDRQRIRREPATLLRYYKISSCCISSLLILVSIPLLLKWMPRNAIYGFRVPSTLRGSGAHWFHVNEVAGAAGITAGVLSIVFALLVVDRLGVSEVVKGRAVLIVTIVLTVAAMIPPFLVR